MNFKNVLSAYLKHLENGYSEKSFSLCDYTKIEEYAQKENLMDKINLAKCASQKFWEAMAINALSGEINNFRNEVWIFVMKSRFGWTGEPPEIPNNEQKIVEVQLKLDPKLGLEDEVSRYTV
jgi:hypothetical protein